MAKQQKGKKEQKQYYKKRDATVVASRFLLILLLFPLSFILLPTMLFLSFSMLPTWISILFSRNRRQYRYCWLCVGGLNLAGSAHYIFQMWFGEHTIEAAANLLTSVVPLVATFGAAAFGWLIFFSIPSIVVVYMQVLSQHRISHLKNVQKKLVEEWGSGITETK